eukprot:1985793-Pyramimonas_sp.AAC.1
MAMTRVRVNNCARRNPMSLACYVSKTNGVLDGFRRARGGARMAHMVLFDTDFCAVRVLEQR